MTCRLVLHTEHMIACDATGSMREGYGAGGLTEGAGQRYDCAAPGRGTAI
ncbi:hypothetical protein SXCC_00529 [Gluconacetobacter sp. SXCC-1]|nr:hypothetical protein SXCC_00529 [Gluconacetobacter sp. SXCC-1]